MKTQTHIHTSTSADGSAFDWRSFGIILAGTLLGAAWAIYNYTSTGGSRGEEQLQPLVWAIFATPLGLFLGWLVARRAEGWLAAFVSFLLIYFFTPFVAARIESLFLSPEEAAATKHNLYFWAVIVVHLLSAAGVAVWRARTPPAASSQPASQPERTPDAA